MNQKIEVQPKKGGIGEIIRYLIVGGLVTLGQLLLIVIFNKVIPGDGSGFGWSNLIAGFIMMFAAFFPYKTVVFRSKNWERKTVIFELLEFISARIFTVLFDIGFVFLFVTFLEFNHSYPMVIDRLGADGISVGGVFPISFVIPEKWVVKFISLAITTVLNYLFSKLIVFKDKKNTKTENEA